MTAVQQGQHGCEVATGIVPSQFSLVMAAYLVTPYLRPQAHIATLEYMYVNNDSTAINLICDICMQNW